MELHSALIPDATATDAVYSIVAGSFRSLSLALLAFYPANRTLQHVETIPAYGPHQYLAASPGKDFVYTTSWADPPILSSWKTTRSHGLVDGIEHVNTVSITATSSYINIPPPYTFIYSAGGPTGEVHARDPQTGGFGEKVQQFLFVPEDELEAADKTRVALRSGSHGIEFSPEGYAFVPVLGTDTIEMYSRDDSGRLVHISSNHSPRGPDAHDGPRHVKLHPNGKVLYCVTEHTNFVDVYEILPRSLRHLQSASILSDDVSPGTLANSTDPLTRSAYRGGTLMLTPSTERNPAPCALFTTTRGSTKDERGWLSVFKLDIDGHIVNANEALRFETPTSSGKANALDIRAKDRSDDGFWILLTDDDAQADKRGAVRVLEWGGWNDNPVRVVAEWPDGESIKTLDVGEGDMILTGASHAIWLD